VQSSLRVSPGQPLGLCLRLLENRKWPLAEAGSKRADASSSHPGGYSIHPAQSKQAPGGWEGGPCPGKAEHHSVSQLQHRECELCLGDVLNPLGDVICLPHTKKLCCAGFYKIV